MAKILIVDDRPLNRQFFTTLLGYHQHTLLEASDGAEGLEIAKQEPPDLIISDVLMPTMDGYEFVRCLREEPQLAKIPVIFSTAHFLNIEAEALARKCAVASVIYKPCDPKQVLDVVSSILDSHPPVFSPPKSEEFDRDHLQLLTNKLAEKAEESRSAVQKLNALFELSQQLASQRDPLALLNEYCSVARELVGSRWAAMLVGEGEHTRRLYTIGLAPDLIDRIDSLILELSEIAGKSQSDGVVVIGPEDSIALTSFPRLESLLAVPLAIHGRSYGCLFLGDKLGTNEFGSSDQKLGKTLAAQMVVAYQNALLLDEARRHTANLEREMAERIKAEQTLRRSEAQLSSLIGSAMDAIVTVDESQHVCLFNAAAEKMFGITSEKAIGQSLDAFIPTHLRDAHRHHIQAFSETHVTTRAMGALGAISGVNAGGREFPIEASISQVEVAGKKLYTAILRDITERRQSERTLIEKNEALASMTQQLWQASKLATMGELAASIAHELNNPLATIALRVETLGANFDADDPKQHAIRIISGEVDRMASLVGNLLQFSRRSQPQLSTLDIREELDRAIDLIHYHLRGRHVKVVKEFDDAVSPFIGDRQQLRQVFLNLITNASDSMPDGGTLTIRVYPAPQALDIGGVVVEFIDTGIGIPDDELQKIWEPFFTTKPEGKGTGLGLPICRRTVEELRGRIDVESEIARGTTIRITLPARDPGHNTLAP